MKPISNTQSRGESASRLRQIIADNARVAANQNILVLTQALPSNDTDAQPTALHAAVPSTDLASIVRDTAQREVENSLPDLIRVEVAKTFEDAKNIFAETLRPAVDSAMAESLPAALRQELPLLLQDTQIAQPTALTPERISELVRAELNTAFGAEVTAKIRQMIRSEIDAWLDEV